MHFQEINVEQGTEEWHKIRSTKIGASDAPPIMGVSPWTTPNQLYKKKMGLASCEEQSYAMQRGTDMEEQARNEFCKTMNFIVEPKVLVSSKHDFMMASMDGISECRKLAVEIKCPGKIDHEKAMDGIIPEKYYPQLQHQMEVCGLGMMFYFSFNGTSGKVLEIERDDDYITKMIKEETKFFSCLQNLEEPGLIDRDFELRDDEEWTYEAKEWFETKKMIDHLQLKEENHRKRLIFLSGSNNVKGAGIRLSKHIRRGSIEYKNVPELIGVDLEKHRKESIEYFKIGKE